MRACSACGSERFEHFLSVAEMFDGERFDIMRCAGCDLLATAGEPSDAELAAYYDYDGGADAGARFNATLEPLMRALRRGRLRSVWKGRREPGRVLDVGCGRGVLLGELQRNGWEVYGTEVDAGVAATARRELGDRIQVGQVQDLSFADAPFDLIMMWHVLEHLTEPRAALARVRELLAEGGTVIIALPNAASWQARLSGRHWLHWDVPRHRHHFTPATLGFLAGRCGLRIAKVEQFSLEYGPYGFLQSGLSKVGLGHLLFTDVLRPGRKKDLWRKPKAWAHLALAAPIAVAGAVSLPLEAVAAASGFGGTMLARMKVA